MNKLTQLSGNGPKPQPPIGLITVPINPESPAGDQKKGAIASIAPSIHDLSLVNLSNRRSQRSDEEAHDRVDSSLRLRLRSTLTVRYREAALLRGR